MILKQEIREENIDMDNAEKIGFTEKINIDYSLHKRVLITGAHSYIGESFEKYAKEHYAINFEIDTIDLKDGTWRNKKFEAYDVVFHVAGIAHADMGNVSTKIKENYYAVNTELAIDVAKKAKTDGVKQFVFMSSMIVYGESGRYRQQRMITKDTIPTPANFYGDSKWQADKGVRALANDNFNVTVLRPPMIYGRGSKGNYPILAKLAKKLPVFPKIENERSMLYIENLCEFLCQIMLIGKSGIFFPQNAEYAKTCEMVKEIAAVSGKKIRECKIFIPGIFLGSKMPGKIGRMINKAFGNMTYDQAMSVYPGLDYQVLNLKESIQRTECNQNTENKGKNKQKHILIISQYFYPEPFRINDMAQEWVKRGYKVTVITGIPNYPMGEFYEGYSYHSRRTENWHGVEIIRIPLIARGHNSIGLVANYASFVISGFRENMKTKIKADYVFTFEVSPMTQALIGVWYSKKHQVPHYLYVQDLWPENIEMVAGIHHPLIIKSIDKMVDYIYKNTNKIFVTSPSFVEAICNRKVSVPKEKVYYWPQYAEEFYFPMKKKHVAEIPDDNSFKVIFTGNIGRAQGLDILPQTAMLLENENVKFVIVGDGRYQSEFEKEIVEKGVLDKFVMVPRQPAERVPEMLAACDVAFLSFMDTKLFEMTIPAKLQSYMACGMPIVASAAGETERIIKEAQCGICNKIGNAEDLASAVRTMMQTNLDEMRKNSRQYFEKHFNKKKLMDLMDSMIN